jgi:hypothetical protein
VVRVQADVFDHMEYILTSLEMFAGIGENLINYTFNVRSLVPFPRAGWLTCARADGFVRDERSDAPAHARDDHLPPPHAPHGVLRDELRQHVDRETRALGPRVRSCLSSLALCVLNSPFARRFWIIALPLMAVVLPVFIVPDIKRMIHYVQKRILAKKIVKVRSPLALYIRILT